MDAESKNVIRYDATEATTPYGLTDVAITVPGPTRQYGVSALRPLCYGFCCIEVHETYNFTNFSIGRTLFFSE